MSSTSLLVHSQLRTPKAGITGEVSTITIASSVGLHPSHSGLILIRSAISHEVMRDYRCQVADLETNCA